jgi:2-keto-3-deoxy-galactonokinase
MKVWHELLQRSLKLTRRTTKRFDIVHYRDVPSAVFTTITNVATQSSFGILVKHTRATTVLKITRPEKLKMLLKLNTSVIGEDVLVRSEKNGAKVQVIVSSEKPFHLRYHKHQHRLTINFKFGYWNEHGVPQHH